MNTSYRIGDEVHGAISNQWWRGVIIEVNAIEGVARIRWEDDTSSELGFVDIRYPPPSTHAAVTPQDRFGFSSGGLRSLAMSRQAIQEATPRAPLVRKRGANNVRKSNSQRLTKIVTHTPSTQSKNEYDFTYMKVVQHTLATPKPIWYSCAFLTLGAIFFLLLMILVPPSEDTKIWWGACIVFCGATVFQVLLFLNNDRLARKLNQTYIGGGRLPELMKGEELAEVLKRAEQKVTQRHAMFDIVNTLRERIVDTWHNSPIITSIENCYKAAGFNKAADIIHDKSESEIDWYGKWLPLHEEMKTKDGKILKVEFGSNMRKLYFHLGAGYLNGAMYGATPRPILHGKRQWVESFQNNPVEFRFKALSLRIRQTATEVAQFLGADPDDTVLLTNQDTAFSSIIKSLPWECGDCLLAFDFGNSNTYRAAHKYLATSHGVFIDFIDIELPISNKDIKKQVKNHLKIRKNKGELPKIAHVPHVTACTAFVLPIRELTEIFHSFNISVIVDGNQAVGNIPVDLSKIKSDWYYGMLSRWLFAAPGVSFLVTQPHKQKVTTTLTVAYNDGDGYTSEFGYTGLQDWSAYFSCIDSFDFINKMCGGFPTVYEYNSRQAVRAVHILTTGWNTACYQGSSSKYGCMPIVLLPGGTHSQECDAFTLTEYLIAKYQITAHILSVRFDGHDILAVRCCCQIYTDDNDWCRLRDAILQINPPPHTNREPYKHLEMSPVLIDYQPCKDAMGRTLDEIQVIDEESEQDELINSIQSGSYGSITIVRPESFNSQGFRRDIYQPTYTNIVHHLVQVAPKILLIIIPAILMWCSVILFICLLGFSKPSDSIDAWKCCVAYLVVAVLFVSYADQGILKKKRKLRKYQPSPKDILLRKGMENKMAKLVDNRESLLSQSLTDLVPGNLEALGSKVYRLAGRIPQAHEDPNRPLIEWNTRWTSLGSNMSLRPFSSTILKVAYGSNVRRLYFRHEKGYINGASYGATPIPIIEAQYKWMKIIQQNPWEWRFKNLFSRVSEVEAMIASEINSNPADTKLMINANAATSTVLKSIIWKDTDRILIFDIDYDATKLAVQWLSRRFGITVLTMKVKLPITDYDLCNQLGDYLAEIRNRNPEELPFLANFCHITSKTAYEFPVRKLTKVFHSFGCLVMVDGAQAVGQTSVDVQSYGCDWYCGTLHKWMYTCPVCLTNK